MIFQDVVPTHRRCAADGRSVTETTMRTVEVVVLEPGRELLIAFLGVGVMADVGPLAQGGLNEAFGLAVGARGVRASEVVAQAELGASVVEQIGLRNVSFRNYADYMLTTEFENAMTGLIALAESSRTAYMCAERVYFRCHRMLVSDWLVARGHEVMHIDGTGPVKPHRLTAEARMIDGELIYRGDRLL